MSETDQAEYLTFRSAREYFGSNQHMTEEEQLQAALEASMKEAGSPEETNGFAPPVKDNPPHPLPKFRLSSAFDSPHKTPLKRTGENSRDGDEVTPFKRSCESDVRRPLTALEEEEDLRRAVELSLACSTPSTPVAKLNATPGTCQVEVAPGPPKWQYRLHSVVRHVGNSPQAGHYIADVFRFDAGGWWRYDDSQVNQTSEGRVLGGNGRREGYIFTYVHQPQWDRWTEGLVDD